MTETAEGTKPSYEDARAELVEVVRALEAGGTTLEESLALWERGEELATVCQEWIDGARERLDAVVAADAADAADSDDSDDSDDAAGGPDPDTDVEY